jgi:hypothetical protein
MTKEQLQEEKKKLRDAYRIITQKDPAEVEIYIDWLEELFIELRDRRDK